MVLQLLVMVAPHTVACEQTSLPHFFKSGFRGWLSGDNLQQTRPPEFTFPKDAHQKHVGKKLFSPSPPRCGDLRILLKTPVRGGGEEGTRVSVGLLHYSEAVFVTKSF